MSDAGQREQQGLLRCSGCGHFFGYHPPNDLPLEKRRKSPCAGIKNGERCKCALFVDVKAMDAEGVAEMLRKPEGREAIRQAFEDIHTGAKRAAEAMGKVGKAMPTVMTKWEGIRNNAKGGAKIPVKYGRHLVGSQRACPGGQDVLDHEDDLIWEQLPDHPARRGTIRRGERDGVEAEVAADVAAAQARVVARAQRVQSVIPACASGGITRVVGDLRPRGASITVATAVVAMIACDRCVKAIDFSHVSLDRAPTDATSALRRIGATLETDGWRMPCPQCKREGAIVSEKAHSAESDPKERKREWAVACVGNGACGLFSILGLRSAGYDPAADDGTHNAFDNGVPPGSVCFVLQQSQDDEHWREVSSPMFPTISDMEGDTRFHWSDAQLLDRYVRLEMIHGNSAPAVRYQLATDLPGSHGAGYTDGRGTHRSMVVDLKDARALDIVARRLET